MHFDPHAHARSQALEGESEAAQRLRERLEVTMSEKEAAVRDKQASSDANQALEQRAEVREGLLKDRLREVEGLQQRVYTLEATVALQQKEVTICREREETLKRRLDEVELSLSQSEVRVECFQARV